MILDLTLLSATGIVGGVSELAGSFGVEWKLLTAQIVNFVLVIFLLHRFAFKPVLNTLGERQKKIADGLRYTEEMKLKLAEAKNEKAQTLKHAAVEAKKIIDEARHRSKDFEEKQAQEAAVKAESIVKKAQIAIGLEKDQMLKDVRKQAADLVVRTTRKVLAKDLTGEERSRFSATAMEELSLN